MQTNQPNWVQYLTLIAVVLSFVIALAAYSQSTTDKTNYNQIDNLVSTTVEEQLQQFEPVTVQTQEINETAFVNAFKTILEEVDTSNSADNAKVKEIWEGVHSTEIAQLKLDSANKVLDEFEATALNNTLDDFETNLESSSDLEDKLDDFLNDEIDGYDQLVSFSIDVDKTKFDIINLGLDDSEDKKVEITIVAKVRYELDSSDDRIKDTVTIIATYYFDDNDEEVDLAYSL